jgi:pimeloyl-ACP methyl ester carboxylesterase
MTKPAVLFVHGFPFDRTMWRHQLAALAGWECPAPNLRGAGSAPAPQSPDEYSMAAYARDLIGMLDDWRIGSAVVCGLSMGGYITFELLRQFPRRVRAVVLCNTKASADTPGAKLGRDALAEKARALGASAVARELVARVLGPDTRQQMPQVVREVTEMIERQPVAGIVGALRALRERPDSTPLLSKISVPVLVVAGDADQITPAVGMREMANAIPGARFVQIEGAGHLTPLEQPAAVNTALTGFLAELG